MEGEYIANISFRNVFQEVGRRTTNRLRTSYHHGIDQKKSNGSIKIARGDASGGMNVKDSGGRQEGGAATREGAGKGAAAPRSGHRGSAAQVRGVAL